MKTDEIRSLFLEFYRAQGHRVLPSDSLIPANDPTLLFTGAGMNQFKEYFLGIKKDMKRATTCQKCLRTGDLDNVGKTPYHHSFFEMLGNFSFGDYFKEDAIRWALEFLTSSLRIPRERLRMSVHTDDDEAYRIWTEKIKVPGNWVAKLGDKSNFWPANARLEGPNGPCGPCSEIFYDQGENYGCRKPECSVDCDCGRFAEIWNLVFTQYNRQEDGSLAPLTAKNIDTGAGLERIACVLQDKRSNFEIDSLWPLVEFVLKKFRLDSAGKEPKSLEFAKTIVDHARAATFAIADGVQPSNEGRGYVVRKLIRRAVWRGKSLAGDGKIKPFLDTIAGQVAQIMAAPYPHLAKELAHISMILKGEEERFLDTLEDGKKVLEKIFEETKKRGSRQIAAEDAFKLYDTYGFPDELTSVLASEEGLSVDAEGFETLMESQRQKAKEGSKIADSIFVTEAIPQDLAKQPTTKFLGYETLRSSAKVLFAELKENEGWVVLDQTPFYAEQGGQVGDRGEIRWQNGQAQVLDTQKKDVWSMHHIKINSGMLTLGTSVDCEVDEIRRDSIRRHHTATHLLHSGLRNVLGPHARQLGSLVNAEKLRFDFSHPKALSEDEIKEIENFVNSAILKNSSVNIEEMTLKEAQKKGALAFFGEKYKDCVRMVQIADDLSKELCGGTHVSRTGDIGMLLITSEASVASGTRRIEAVAGLAALDYSRSNAKELEKLAGILRSSKDEIAGRIEKLQSKVKELEKRPGMAAKSAVDVQTLIKNAIDVRGIKVVTHAFSGLEVNALRGTADLIRKDLKEENLSVFFTVAEDGAVKFVVASVCGKIDASKIANRVAGILEGSGGGKKEFAQGGSKRPDLIEKAKAALPNILNEFLA